MAKSKPVNICAVFSNGQYDFIETEAEGLTMLVIQYVGEEEDKTLAVCFQDEKQAIRSRWFYANEVGQALIWLSKHRVEQS